MSNIMGRQNKRKSNKNGNNPLPLKNEIKLNHSNDSSTLVELINRFNSAFNPCQTHEEVVLTLITDSTTSSNLLTLTTKTLESPAKDQQQQQLHQVVLMIGHRRLHRIAYTSQSLALAREVVFQKAFAWLANLSFLVATFKTHYQKTKTSSEIMRPLCLPGLLFVETTLQNQNGHRSWYSTLKLLGRRSELKSHGFFPTSKEAEASVFEQAVAYLKDELADRILEPSPKTSPAPYIFTAADSRDNSPLSSTAAEEDYPLPSMPDHLDSWLVEDF